MRALRASNPARGQVIVLFALVLTVVVFAAGLVIDGGLGLAQRRAAQNASDFGALAGARIIAEFVSGDTVNGTDANVQSAVSLAVTKNGGRPVTFGAPNGPLTSLRPAPCSRTSAAGRSRPASWGSRCSPAARGGPSSSPCSA
jgi:uncharacterized membrane protein